MWDFNSASSLSLAVSGTQAPACTPPRWRSRPLSSVLSSALLAGKFLLAQTLVLGPAWWGKRKGQRGEVAEGSGPGWSAERQAAVRSREPRAHPRSRTGPAGVGETLGTAASSRGREAGRAGREGRGARRTRACAVRSPRRRAARREHSARNWRARLAGGTLSSRRTRPGPGGCGAVAAAGAQADPRADPRKELKEVGAPVAAGVGAVKEDGHGDSSVVRVVGAGHRRELLHVWLLGARACGPLACLTVVGGGGDRNCSMKRVAFLALPTQLLRARRRRRHLEPATPRLASLRVGGSDRDCSVPERSRVYEEPNDVTVCDLAVVEQI
nr:uncharacterized protein LOC115933101 [Gorilla gorilla gorilla]